MFLYFAPLSSLQQSNSSVEINADSAQQNNDDNPSNPDKRKGGWPKGKKRRKAMRDTNAPKQPLNGYVRFLNERREQVRQENPSLSFTEVTKLLGAEWTKLDKDQKQMYLDEAIKDKERFQKEWTEYQKTDAYKKFLEMQKSG